MIVAKITTEKAEYLKDTSTATGTQFNPVLDKNGKWIISLLEAQYLELEDLELIEWEPPIQEEL